MDLEVTSEWKVLLLYITSLNHLGTIYSDMGADERAAPLHQKALEQLNRARLLVPPSQDERFQVQHEKMRKQRILCYVGLASYEAFRGEYAEAERLYHDSHTLGTELSKSSERDKFAALVDNNLGLLYWKMGDYDEASRHIQEAFERYQRQVEEDPSIEGGMPKILNNLGELLQLRGSFSDAIDYY